MLDESLLFRGKDIVLNDEITVHHPTLEEIFEYGEQGYFSMISTFSATPTDYMVQLYDMKILYTELSDFQMFTMLYGNLTPEKTAILFGAFDFSKMVLMKYDDNDEVVLCDPETEFVIDETVYTMLSTIICSIHSLKKRVEKAANKSTLKTMIELERLDQARQKKQKKGSTLIPLISAMVNSENFKYDHKSVWSLPIYTFYDSVKRIQKIKNYNNIMNGCYTGNIDMKKLSLDEFDWLGSNNNIT